MESNNPIHPNTSNNSNNNDSGFSSVDAYLGSLPPGYRFHPYDDELIVKYLRKKIFNENLPPCLIHDVQLYDFNPDELARIYIPTEKEVWYFFTPRNKKYKNGSRPQRAAGNGFWKATGADKLITLKGEIIGSRKTLIFYMGKPPKCQKTTWIMHEFRLPDYAIPTPRRALNDMTLDDWVLCRIFKKANKGNKDKEHKGTSVGIKCSPSHSECISTVEYLGGGACDNGVETAASAHHLPNNTCNLIDATLKAFCLPSSGGGSHDGGAEVASQQYPSMNDDFINHMEQLMSSFDGGLQRFSSMRDP